MSLRHLVTGEEKASCITWLVSVGWGLKSGGRHHGTLWLKGNKKFAQICVGRKRESLFINIEKLNKTFARFPICHLKWCSLSFQFWGRKHYTVFSIQCTWPSTVYELRQWNQIKIKKFLNLILRSMQWGWYISQKKKNSQKWASLF